MAFLGFGRPRLGTQHSVGSHETPYQGSSPVGDWTTHRPVADQRAPLYWRPVWHVGHLVFQGGIPTLKRSSLTGGGFLPMKDLAGREAPSWQPYATPISSQTGGGFTPARPNFTQALAGGADTSQF